MWLRLIVTVALTVPLPALAADPITPDPTLTPGAWNNPPSPLTELCRPHYAQTLRHVDDRLKDAVFRRYGYDPRVINHGDYEIDHLVSLELDGTNAIENLWVESYVTQPLNAHRKDVLENALHRLVCHGQIELTEAQHAIATDWVAAYRYYVLHGLSEPMRSTDPGM